MKDILLYINEALKIKSGAKLSKNDEFFGVNVIMTPQAIADFTKYAGINVDKATDVLKTILKEYHKYIKCAELFSGSHSGFILYDSDKTDSDTRQNRLGYLLYNRGWDMSYWAFDKRNDYKGIVPKLVLDQIHVFVVRHIE